MTKTKTESVVVTKTIT